LRRADDRVTWARGKTRDGLEALLRFLFAPDSHRRISRICRAIEEIGWSVLRLVVALAGIYIVVKLMLGL
jgi:hypothetical protein